MLTANHTSTNQPYKQNTTATKLKTGDAITPPESMVEIWDETFLLEGVFREFMILCWLLFLSSMMFYVCSLQLMFFSLVVSDDLFVANFHSVCFCFVRWATVDAVVCSLAGWFGLLIADYFMTSFMDTIPKVFKKLSSTYR